MDQGFSIQNEYGIPGPIGTDMAFAVGFFFSFRWILSLFAITVLGVETHASGALSLALNFLLLGLVCIHSLGSAKQKFTSMLGLNSLRWVMARSEEPCLEQHCLAYCVARLLVRDDCRCRDGGPSASRGPGD